MMRSEGKGQEVIVVEQKWRRKEVYSEFQESTSLTSSLNFLTA
jgi:hypothetical protein